MLLVSWALLAPLLLRLTAPVKALPAWVRVMAWAPAAKLLAPVTLAAPVWVIAPPAVAAAVRLALKLPSASLALSNCRVRLRRLVRPLRVGVLAPALTSRKAKSRMLAAVPPTLTAPARLLACVLSRSEERRVGKESRSRRSPDH